MLERLHGNLGKPLAEGNWPGFSKRFLQAIDAAMTIHPTERPQSIREWLALFGKKDGEEAILSDADEPTRFFAHEVATDEIVPVAPPVTSVDPKKPLETSVPTDPGQVEFKRVGEETGTSKRKRKKELAAESAAAPAKSEEVRVPAPVAKAGPAGRRTEKAAAAARGAAGQPAEPWYKNPRAALLAGGGALLLAGGAGIFMLRGGNSDGAAGNETGSDWSWTGTTSGADVGGLAPAERALAEEARNAGAPATAVNNLVAAGALLEKQAAEMQALLNDPAQAAAATARADEMKRTATSANVEFANALLRDAEARTAEVPLASQSGLRSALSELRASVQASANATDPAQSLTAAREALAKSQAFAAALPAAYRELAASRRATDALARTPTRPAPGAVPSAPASTAAVAPAVTPDEPDTGGVSSAKIAQLNGVIDGARSMARQVIQMGAGSSASPAHKANAQQARNYDKYLANLKDSGRGVKSNSEADRLIKDANQTKAYIVFLNRQSSQSQ